MFDKKTVTPSGKSALKNPVEGSRTQSPTSTAQASVSNTNLERRRNHTTTRVTIKFDVGFGNSLYIRGKGAGLSWDKGILLKNLKTDEWIWETDLPFTQCEFKVLINDKEFELGDNHLLSQGATIQFAPKFIL